VTGVALDGSSTRTTPRQPKRCAAPGCGKPLAEKRDHGRCCSGACRMRLRRFREQARLPFEPPIYPLPRPYAPATDPAVKPKLQELCWAILARLRRGPATNSELAGLGGLRFGARIGELRGGKKLPDGTWPLYQIHTCVRGRLAVYWSLQWMEE
jgi:hypothetical protein